MDNIFYVYVHRKPSGEVFYVGKGKGKRAWSHSSRNRFWKFVVEKYGYSVEIVDDNLPESQAFELEEFLISYYKSRNQGGTLVNMTNGGEGSSGYIPSSETRAKTSAKSKGSANGNSDKGIYDFVNFHTGEKYTGTRQDFVTKYSIDVGHLFRTPKVMTAKGWCLLKNYDKIDTPKHDCRVHKFVHISGEVIVATRDDFKTKTGVNTSPLFGAGKNRCDSTQGWALEGNAEKIRLHAQHNKVHSFENKDGVVIQATRSDFESQTGINPEGLFRKKKRNSVGGWCLVGNSEKIVIAMPRDEVHTFVHSDGYIITSTRKAFKGETGISPENLFRKAPAKTTHGWSLLPTQP